jgi:hypothetical protein
MEQDILLHVVCPSGPANVSERLIAALRDAGLGSTTRALPASANQSDQLSIQVPLFGRREDLGFNAIAAMRAVAFALELPSDTIYVFQQHGHPDTTLIFRFAQEGQVRVDTKRKLQELTELARKAAA